MGAGLVRFTNVSDDDATLMHLARRGYGSLAELAKLDTPALLDLVEFEQIQRDLEKYHIDTAREG